MNYASKDCGAKILGSNPEAENVDRILTSNKDDYMINPCTVSKKWWVDPHFHCSRKTVDYYYRLHWPVSFWFLYKCVLLVLGLWLSCVNRFISMKLKLAVLNCFLLNQRTLVSVLVTGKSKWFIEDQLVLEEIFKKYLQSH